MEKINNQYLALHNLNSLKQIEKKINCYNQYSQKPH